MAKIERTKNAGKGIFFGTILKTYQIIVPFIMRTVMIYCMGVDYVGLNSLFTSVLNVLNIAELGVGAAMVFCMYEPIAKDDDTTICALMKLYKIYYRVIGLIVAVCGCVLTPFIPYFIKSDVPQSINIYILYSINLAATVLSYWLFAYKNSILQAHQRVDVISKVTLLTSTVQYICQFIILIRFRNYYAYVIVALLTQVLTNVFIAIASNRLYPNFKDYGRLEKSEVRKINQRIKDLFTAKIGGTITNSADTIIISSFMGLTVLAIYQNYYFIMNAVCGFIAVIFSSVTAGIGNSLVTESLEKNYNDFKKFSFIICFLLNLCCCCFVAIYQPFMRLWVGEELMLGEEFVFLFCILFYLLELAMVWATVKDAAGLWHADRFRPLIGSSANLVMNIIFVRPLGLYGVILSTIISYSFISMPWLVHNLFKLLYKRSIRCYFFEILRYVIVTAVCCLIVYIFCKRIAVQGIPEILIKGISAILISVFIQVFIFRKNKEYKEMICLIKSIKKYGGVNGND